MPSWMVARHADEAPRLAGFAASERNASHLSLSVPVWADEFIRPTARGAK